MKPFVKAAIPLCLLIPLASCSGPPGEDELTSQPLTGTATLTGCTNATYRSQLTESVKRANTAVRSADMKAWLTETVLEGPQHYHNNSYETGPEFGTGYPEFIASRMQEAINTRITCDRNIGASSYKNPTESITMYDTQSPSSTTDLDAMAGVVAHEVAHSKGFDHPFHADATTIGGRIVGFDVPDFMTNAVPDILKHKAVLRIRSGEPQETTLAPVGLHQGETIGELFCPDTTVATGIFGSYRTGDLAPSGLGLRCKAGNVAGPATSSTSQAGSGDAALGASCTNSEVMIGLWGRSNKGVQSVAPICAPQAKVWVSDPSTTTLRPGFGNAQDLSWTRQCPAGMAVRGFRPGTDFSAPTRFLSRLELICQRLASTEPITTALWRASAGGPAAGGAGFTWSLDRCIGRQAMHALKVGVTRDGQRVRRIEGVCTRFLKDSSSPDEGASVATERTGLPVPGYGGDGSEGSPLYLDCSGSVLVGMDVQSDPVAGIQGLRGIGGDLRYWPDGNTPEAWALTYTQNVGQSDIATRYKCPRGWYLAGFWASEQEGVKGLMGSCRPFKVKQ
jgi:hypothetical protein